MLFFGQLQQSIEGWLTPREENEDPKSPKGSAACVTRKEDKSSMPSSCPTLVSPIKDGIETPTQTPMLQQKNRVETPATIVSSTPFENEEEQQHQLQQQQGQEEDSWEALPPLVVSVEGQNLDPDNHQNQNPDVAGWATAFITPLAATSRVLNFDAFVNPPRPPNNNNNHHHHNESWKDPNHVDTIVQEQDRKQSFLETSLNTTHRSMGNPLLDLDGTRKGSNRIPSPKGVVKDDTQSKTTTMTNSNTSTAMDHTNSLASPSRAYASSSSSIMKVLRIMYVVIMVTWISSMAYSKYYSSGCHQQSLSSSSVSNEPKLQLLRGEQETLSTPVMQPSKTKTPAKRSLNSHKQKGGTTTTATTKTNTLKASTPSPKLGTLSASTTVAPSAATTTTKISTATSKTIIPPRTATIISSWVRTPTTVHHEQMDTEGPVVVPTRTNTKTTRTKTTADHHPVGVNVVVDADDMERFHHKSFLWSFLTLVAAPFTGTTTNSTTTTVAPPNNNNNNKIHHHHNNKKRRQEEDDENDDDPSIFFSEMDWICDHIQTLVVQTWQEVDQALREWNMQLQRKKKQRQLQRINHYERSTTIKHPLLSQRQRRQRHQSNARTATSSSASYS